MGNKNAGQPHGIVQLANQPRRRAERDGVKPRKGFVVHHQFGVQRDGTCQGNTSGHAARDLAGHEIARAPQSHGVEFHQHNVANQGFRQIGVFTQWKSHVLENIQVSKQGTKLEQHAHAAAGCIQFRLIHHGDVTAVKQHLARLRPALPADQTKNGCFSTTGRPHQGSHLAARD